MGGTPYVARGVTSAALISVALAAACIRVPPAAKAMGAAPADARLPEAGAPVVVVGLGPSDVVDGAPYVGKACVVESIEPSIEARGFARALLACGAEQVLFAAVKLREVTKLATQRRLPPGLAVKIAGIGNGDVYFEERERFIGNRCVVVALRRSTALFYQGTLSCFGVPYQFAYVALAASP